MEEKISKKFESLEEGDQIIFNGRQEPLEVTGGYSKKGNSVMVKGPRSGRYYLVQNRHNPEKIGIVSMTSVYADKGWIEGLQVVENV